MKRLVPLLRRWIDDVERDAHHVQTKTNVAIEAKRKRKRTAITDPETIQILNKQFLKSQHPTNDQITVMARSFDIDKEALRTWFQSKRAESITTT